MPKTGKKDCAHGKGKKIKSKIEETPKVDKAKVHKSNEDKSK